MAGGLTAVASEGIFRDVLIWRVVFEGTEAAGFCGTIVREIFAVVGGEVGGSAFAVESGH